MADSYQPTYWTNNTTPAINAANLRKIEKGIADAHGIANATLESTGKVDRVRINDGAGNYLQIPSLTNTERNNLAAENGMVIYNSTLECLQTRRGGAWVDLHAGQIRDGLNLNNRRITNLGAPTSDGDAVTRKFMFDNAGNVPSGAILMWPAVFAPNGWLECDGAAISRSVYSELFGVIGTEFGAGNGSTTFNLPDLRGEFIRGWDHGRGVDSGREMGEGQGDAFKSHSHDYLGAGDYKGGVRNLFTKIGSQNAYARRDDLLYATGGTETRPRNVALMYIIKV